MASEQDLQAAVASVEQKVTELQSAVANEKTEIDTVIASLKNLGSIPDSLVQSLTESANRLGTIAGDVSGFVTPDAPATPS